MNRFELLDDIVLRTMDSFARNYVSAPNDLKRSKTTEYVCSFLNDAKIIGAQRYVQYYFKKIQEYEEAGQNGKGSL